MNVVRNFGKADDRQLTAIREHASQLLDELEQFMGGDLVEALCRWREAAKKQQQDHRAAQLQSADAKVPPLRAVKAS